MSQSGDGKTVVKKMSL